MTKPKYKATKEFHIYLTPDLAEMVEEVAASEERSVNGQIRFWIMQALKKLAGKSGGKK